MKVNVKVKNTTLKVVFILQYISKSYSDIKGLKTVAFVPTGEGINIIIIHDMDDRVDALTQLQKRFFQVENAFSGIYFEQIVLHISQVDPLILKNAEVILQK